MAYVATIFLSSFLLFIVQPLVARLILPWFGGSAAVWTTCMMFFQALLLAGYLYAHAGVARLAPRVHSMLHIALLAASLALLPIAPGEGWKPAGEANPVAHILLLLTATVGLPYFLLASTSPLIQAWYARAWPGRNPYRLYAVSNIASLAALAAYPFVIEPWLPSARQVQAWSWLYTAFVAVSAALAWRARGASVRAPLPDAGGALPAARTQWLWLAYACTGSVLLLAVTNHLTQNVASVPLLWLAPLTLYLLSFIVTFGGRPLYRRERWWALVLLAVAAMAWLLVDKRVQFNLGLQLGLFLPGLFIGCVLCHGELYARRPPSEALTRFYVIVSAGGALGGVLVAIVAPLAFNAYHELGIALVAAALLAAISFAAVHRVARIASLGVLLGVTGCAVYDGLRAQQDVRVAMRGFYGVLRVTEHATGDEMQVRRLLHGAIMHGEQYVHAPWRAMATTYYGATSGIGAALQAKRDRPLRVGVVGLGVGTLAAYGRPGDVYRFYDIDPRVVHVAKTEFSYLADTEARVELALGDARLRLEREPPQRFDLLAIDAFSGDSIPVHLITREAIEVYLRHIAPEGILALHVSNRFLDLEPVVGQLVRELGLAAVAVRDEPGDDAAYGVHSDWMLIARRAEALAHPDIRGAGAAPLRERPALRAWTDDYSNLASILKADGSRRDD